MKTLMLLAAAMAMVACAQVKPDGSSAPTPASATSVPGGGSTGAAVATAANAATPARAQAAPAPVYGAPQKADPDPKDVAKYKVVVANKIAGNSDLGVKADAPRPTDASIKGLTVVGLQVRNDGQIDKAWIVRPSGDDALDRKALDSVKKASPLPQPPEDVMLGRGYTVFAESWIHRTDGRFQLVSKTVSGSDASSNVASKASAVKRASTTTAAKPTAKTVTQ